jgi:Zn-dependent peptidase ImmA (M78 family)
MSPVTNWFTIEAGKREVLSAEVRLWPDPDPGATDDEALAASWGELALWVGGRNVSEHRAVGERHPAVRWYLLEILEWLAENWDAILHEERLPSNESGIVAAQTMGMIAKRIDFEDGDAFARWQAWWQRHNIKAGETGGIFPNVFIRRRRGEIEVSWDSREVEYAVEGFEFSDPVGHAVVTPREAEEVLWTVLSGTVEALVDRVIGSTRLATLKSRVDALRDEQRTNDRLALMAGLGRTPGEMINRWHRAVSNTANAESRSSAFCSQHDDLVVFGSAVAAVMFGSTAPNVSDEDVQLLTSLMVSAESSQGETWELKDLTVRQPLADGIEEAWSQGYDLAEGVHRALLIDTGKKVDVEDIVRRLGINKVPVKLLDVSIRGASLCSPDHTPTIVINREFMHGDTAGIRRFTVAHELCHLLFDRDHAAEVAVASGPWAPRDIERRANAFAAMFLMPRELVQKAVSAATAPLERFDGVKQVIEALGLPAITVLHHLSNLQFIDESTRDGLLERLELDAKWIHLPRS